VSKAPTYLLRVEKGALVPDRGTAMQLRAKGYRIGDELSATLRKARSPGFHRLAHQFGALVADNIDAFEGLDGHKVLKRLQIEGNVACDEVPLNFPGVGPCTYRVPRSLSFDNMDEGEFREVFTAMCRYVAKTYWHSCTADQIEAMASAMPEAA
jgi:hypothetical protein